MSSISNIQKSLTDFEFSTDLKSLQQIVNVNWTSNIQYLGSSIIDGEITRCYYIIILTSNCLLALLRPVWIKGGKILRIIPLSMT